MLRGCWLLVAACGRIAFDPRGDAQPATGDGDIDAALAVYGDVSDPSRWTTFDATTVAAGANGFTGGTFDGRYMYFGPGYNGSLSGLVVRYDTQAPFGTTSSWQTFDTTTLDPNASGFAGIVNDGRYLYFVPTRQTMTIAPRYDTQADFATATSWELFDMTPVGASVGGYFGGTFDGRYVYFSPSFVSVVARYDTQSAFSLVSSWQQFDLDMLSMFTERASAVFDGRYVYFPGWFSNGTVTGYTSRYDTTAPFTPATSWETFDTSVVGANAIGYGGVAFDGTHIYMVPFTSMGGANGTAVRYDPRATFSATSSWQTFDESTVNAGAKGNIGATFDGRRIFFAPYPNGVVTAFDTTRDFSAPNAYSFFDLKSINASATGYYGAVFDGEYIYFVAHAGGTIARFDARTPGPLPALPGFHGSFL